MRSMSSVDYHWWLAFEEVEPDPIRHLDRMFAQLSCLVANANRDRKRRPSPYKEEDFLVLDRIRAKTYQEEEAAELTLVQRIKNFFGARRKRIE